MRTIVTHASHAHFDETMAAALILAEDPDIRCVIRTNEVTEDQLENPETYVVDTSRNHDPARLNFDHHQDPELPASYVLVANHFGRLSLLEPFPWFAYRSAADCHGVKAAQKAADIEGDLRPLQSPIHRWIIDDFSDAHVLAPSYRLFKNLMSLGRYVLGQGKRLQSELGLIRGEGEEFSVVVRPNESLDSHVSSTARGLFLDAEAPRLGLAECDYDLTITRDPRRGGWALYRKDRLKDAVDFRQIKGREDVLFAHGSGFLATTTKEANPHELVQKAICS